MKIIINLEIFNPIINSSSFLCFSEIFPNQETIKLDYKIIGYDKKEISEYQLKIFINDNFTEDLKEKNKDFFQISFNEESKFKFCFNNDSQKDLIVKFELRKSYDLKKYHNLPNKELISNFDFYFTKAEAKINYIKTNLDYSKKWSKKDLTIIKENDNIYSSILKFSFYIIIIIFITKLFQLYFLQNKIKQKKYL